MDRSTITTLQGLPPGYTVRRPVASDAPDVYALIVASDIAEFGESRGYELEELLDDWKHVDAENDLWVAFAPDGTLVGYLYRARPRPRPLR